MSTITTTTIEQNPVHPLRIRREHAKRLARAGWWIILGAVIPISIWMAFAALCLTIVDELNANLDGDGEIALVQAMSGLRSEGVTTVVVTHRPSLIAHVDKILVLEAGRVAQFGPAAEVMKAMQRKNQAMVDDDKIAASA